MFYNVLLRFIRSDVLCCFTPFYSILSEAMFDVVLLRFTPFYLCTLTFIVLNCLLVFFIMEFEWPKRQILTLCIK